jgi:hypothetical protein
VQQVVEVLQTHQIRVVVVEAPLLTQARMALLLLQEMVAQEQHRPSIQLFMVLVAPVDPFTRQPLLPVEMALHLVEHRVLLPQLQQLTEVVVVVGVEMEVRLPQMLMEPQGLLVW